MARRLHIFFVFLLAVASLTVILNFLWFLTDGSVGTGLTNASTYFVLVQLSQNDENKKVDEISYELAAKQQTREQMNDVISSELKTVNNISRFHHHSPKPHIVPVHHASDAWNSGFIHRLTVTDLPSIVVSGADCAALFRGNRTEHRKARKFQRTYKKEVVLTEKFIQQTSNCTQFVADRRYAMWPVNREEADFPIAFSILMYKDVEQFERLLRAVYRPQNRYCIHVDKQSLDDVHAAVAAIARCFDNVFVLQPSIEVHWGTFSVLEPELACMKRLLRRSKKWRYFINLTGQEFPLKTNWQIVRILKAFNGSNNMEGIVKRFVFLKKMRFFAPWGRRVAPINEKVNKESGPVAPPCDCRPRNRQNLELCPYICP